MTNNIFGGLYIVNHFLELTQHFKTSHMIKRNQIHKNIKDMKRNKLIKLRKKKKTAVYNYDLLVTSAASGKVWISFKTCQTLASVTVII